MGVEDVKKLREMTSMGISECKKALSEANGDLDKALNILKEKGVRFVDKRGDRSASQGLIESYVHFGGNLGVIVEINCETDFVARTDNFKKFVKDIAMHIAALGPEYIKKEDIPEGVLSKVENAEDFIKQRCLIEQEYVKDHKMTIGEYLKSIIAQTGEKVVIRRFARFSLGE